MIPSLYGLAKGPDQHVMESARDRVKAQWFSLWTTDLEGFLFKHGLAGSILSILDSLIPLGLELSEECALLASSQVLLLLPQGSHFKNHCPRLHQECRFSSGRLAGRAGSDLIWVQGAGHHSRPEGGGPALHAHVCGNEQAARSLS